MRNQHPAKRLGGVAHLITHLHEGHLDLCFHGPYTLGN